MLEKKKFSLIVFAMLLLMSISLNSCSSNSTSVEMTQNDVEQLLKTYYKQSKSEITWDKGTYTQIDASKYPDADDIIIEQNMEFDYSVVYDQLRRTYVPNTYITYHSKVMIKNKRRSNYAQLRIQMPYNFSLIELKARTINEDGVTEVREEDILTSNVIYGLGSPTEIKNIAFPLIKEGSIIEYKYTVGLPFQLYSEEFSLPFFSTAPVLNLSYQVKVPIDFLTIHYKNLNDAPLPVVEVIKDENPKVAANKMLYKWDLKDIKPIEEEIFMIPMQSLPFANIKLYTIKNNPNTEDRNTYVSQYWEDIALYFLTIMKSFEKWTIAENPLTEVKRFTLDLVEGIENEEEKVEKILRFIQDEILIVNSWSKRFSDIKINDVLDYRFGNSYTITTLLYEMLKSIDLKPAIAAFRSKTRSALDKSYISLNQIDGFMVCLEKNNEYVWLYPYEKGYPVGSFPVYYQEAEAFVFYPEEFLEEDGTKIPETKWTELPVVDASENKVDIDTKIKINKDFSFKMESTFEFTGYSAISLRNQILSLPKGQIGGLLVELLKSVQYGVEEIQIKELKNLYDYKSPLIVKYEYENTRIVFPDAGDNKLLRIGLLLNFSFIDKQFSSDERQYDMNLGAKNTTIEKITISEIPKGYKLRHNLENIKERNSIYKIHQTINSSENDFNFDYEATLLENHISSEDFQKVKDYFAYLSDIYRYTIFLEKK